MGCVDATDKLSDGQVVTVSCAEGDDGFIYEGRLNFSVTEGDSGELPELDTKIMMNIGNPEPRLRPSAASPMPASVWHGWSSSSTPPSACTHWRY